jgi:hypothetical protein
MSGLPTASAAPASASTAPTIDPLEKEADNRKWDCDKVPEYNGTNCRRWDRAVTGEFMVHNVDWLLEKRLPGDDIIHKRAIVIIRQTVDETHDNIIDDCTDAFEIYANVVHHHKAWLQINMPRIQEELAMIRQRIDESADAYLSRLQALSSDLARGGWRIQEEDLVQRAIRGALPRYIAVAHQNNVLFVGLAQLTFCAPNLR